MNSDDARKPKDSESRVSEKEDKKAAGEQPEAPVNKVNNPDGPAKKKPFLEMLKKVGFSVWITVMAIGGILAFLTSLLLL